MGLGWWGHTAALKRPLWLAMMQTGQAGLGVAALPLQGPKASHNGRQKRQRPESLSESQNDEHPNMAD